MHENGVIGSKDPLYVLGLGPDQRITRYTGIVVNGIRFHTVDRDKYHRTQNSGIIVKGEHQSEEVDFYGVLTDIIELEYCHGNRVFMFKCDWWDFGNKNTGIKKDGHLITVNVSRRWYMDDPFVLATQAEQVFYVNDIKNGDNWKIVQKTYPRNLYEVPEKEENDDDEGTILNDEPYQQFDSDNINEIAEFDDGNMSPLCRTDVCPDQVDADVILPRTDFVSLDDTFDDDVVDEEDDTIIDYNTDDGTDNEKDGDNNDEEEDQDDDGDDDVYCDHI